MLHVRLVCLLVSWSTRERSSGWSSTLTTEEWRSICGRALCTGCSRFTFPLINISAGLCLGGTTSPILEYCNLPNSNQLCYDAGGVTLWQLINLVGDSTPKLKTDEEQAEFDEVKQEFNRFETLQSQLSRGTIAVLPPLSPFQQVIKSIWRYCAPGVNGRAGCLGYVFAAFNFLHNLVQQDIAAASALANRSNAPLANSQAVHLLEPPHKTRNFASTMRHLHVRHL
jgi:hypothetical protein